MTTSLTVLALSIVLILDLFFSVSPLLIYFLFGVLFGSALASKEEV